jgi:L-rhamnose mutarotase
MKLSSILLILVLAVASCREQAYEEHIYAVSISTEPNKLQEYLAYHDSIWPEVEAGFKLAGYKEINMFRFEQFIVMQIKVPAGANLSEMSKNAADSHPRCAEWNQLMDTYQIGLPGTSNGQKWVELNEFYSFKKPE